MIFQVCSLDQTGLVWDAKGVFQRRRGHKSPMQHCPLMTVLAHRSIGLAPFCNAKNQFSEEIKTSV